MLVFNLKKEWFEKIKSGEKTHEYNLRTNEPVYDIEFELIKENKHEKN